MPIIDATEQIKPPGGQRKGADHGAWESKKRKPTTKLVKPHKPQLAFSIVDAAAKPKAKSKARSTGGSSRDRGGVIDSKDRRQIAKKRPIPVDDSPNVKFKPRATSSTSTSAKAWTGHQIPSFNVRAGEGKAMCSPERLKLLNRVKKTTTSNSGEGKVVRSPERQRILNRVKERATSKASLRNRSSRSELISDKAASKSLVSSSKSRSKSSSKTRSKDQERDKNRKQGRKEARVEKIKCKECEEESRSARACEFRCLSNFNALDCSIALTLQTDRFN
jgi:hypothetical protein